MITKPTMLVNFKFVVYHPTYYGAPCRRREPSFILIGMSYVRVEGVRGGGGSSGVERGRRLSQCVGFNGDKYILINATQIE